MINKNSLLIVVISVCMLTISCSKKAKEIEKVSEEIPVVEIAQITKMTLGETLNGAGVLASKSEVKLAFKTGGLVKKTYVNEGQFVKAGQLLAELDLSEINAQVNQASLGLQKAQRDLDRVKKLVADEAATQTNLQDATTAVDLATQGVQVASFNQKLSRIYAPTAGVILRKVVEQGELITPFAPAFVLGSSTSDFIVNVGLADKDIIKVKLGNTAIVSLDAYPGINFKATVTQIAQTVNPTTGTFEVELQVDSQGKKLVSGFVANAKIVPAGQSVSLMVPIAALTEAEGQMASVYCLSGANNSVIKKEIKIGNIKEEYVQLISGLIENEVVITKGGGFLTDGQKVKIVKP